MATLGYDQPVKQANDVYKIILSLNRLSFYLILQTDYFVLLLPNSLTAFVFGDSLHPLVQSDLALRRGHRSHFVVKEFTFFQFRWYDPSINSEEPHLCHLFNFFTKSFMAAFWVRNTGFCLTFFVIYPLSFLINSKFSPTVLRLIFLDQGN